MRGRIFGRYFEMARRVRQWLRDLCILRRRIIEYGQVLWYMRQSAPTYLCRLRV